MSIEVSTGTTLTFERFWTWLLNHPNCVLRAGSSEVALYDQEDLHWHFEEEAPGMYWVQLIRGKQLLGELLIDARNVQYVQAIPDEESGDRGWVQFEIITGSKEESFPAYHFLLSHGLNQETAHPAGLKH